MQSFFTGLAGMFNFSKSLDNVSNNISNMNTPGYRGSDIFMRSIGGSNEGYGSFVDGKSIRTQQGDLKQTGNNTDLAINGDGYFVLKDANGDLFYSRGGQFKFNDKNILVDADSSYEVMAMSSTGTLTNIDASNYKVLPPAATTQVNLVGNLGAGDSTYKISDVSVYDAAGNKVLLSVDFTKQALPAVNTWTVSVKSPTQTELANFDISFGIDSTPTTASAMVTQSINLGTAAQDIKFNFGTTGSFSGTTQFSGNSNLGANVQDGHVALGVQSYSFDEKGILNFKYTNGEKKVGQQIALAAFNDPESLTPSSKGLYVTSSNEGLKYGKPNQDRFGSIQSKSIEMSNVDLTQEFAEILILQRGYQASSRVMSVANDLLDQLYNNTRSK